MAAIAKVETQERFDLRDYYRDTLGESEISRFRLKIDALSADEQSMSFSWRAPGLSLVASPNVYIETSWKIVAPKEMDFMTSIQPMFGSYTKREWCKRSIFC